MFTLMKGSLDENEDMTGDWYELFKVHNNNIHIYRYNISYGKPDKPYPAEGDSHRIYFGKCPSINEFRKICKFLGI